MSGVVEFVKNSYYPTFLGSTLMGGALGVLRNVANDIIDSSELLKYNMMSYAAGNMTHPNSYEWEK
jgi:hypothetical protein